jgi:hypothetical protein
MQRPLVPTGTPPNTEVREPEMADLGHAIDLSKARCYWDKERLFGFYDVLVLPFSWELETSLIIRVALTDVASERDASILDPGFFTSGLCKGRKTPLNSMREMP